MELSVSAESTIYVDIVVTPTFLDRLDGDEDFRDIVFGKLSELDVIDGDPELEDGFIRVEVKSGFDMEELEAEVTDAIGEYDNEIGVVTFHGDLETGIVYVTVKTREGPKKVTPQGMSWIDGEGVTYNNLIYAVMCILRVDERKNELNTQEHTIDQRVDYGCISSKQEDD